MRWTLLLCGVLVVSCGAAPAKNPGTGQEMGSAWAESLAIDPTARLGQTFAITFTLTYAVNAIEATTVEFILPPEVTLVKGRVRQTDLRFQTADDYHTTIWVRIDALDQPIVIQARAAGTFVTNHEPAIAGAVLYLTTNGTAIVTTSFIPQPTARPGRLVEVGTVIPYTTRFPGS